MTIEVKQVLRMNEGIDETSYAKTSYIQKQVLSLTKSVREKAMKEFYCKEQPPTLCIADLGCSSAELNNLSVIFELIETVEKARRELGIGYQEYQVYLNDLPGNDFNTIFRSLTCFENNLKQNFGDGFGNCFVNGVPGSFYGRLFPASYLQFVHSSYSLMWLSQGLIEEEKLNTFNLPQYTPSAKELGCIVEKEGSFTLNQAHVSEVSWEASELDKNKDFDCYDFVKCMRSVAEPLLIHHFGGSIIEELFQRYMEIVRVSMAKEDNVFVNVTVSLTRKD